MYLKKIHLFAFYILYSFSAFAADKEELRIKESLSMYSNILGQDVKYSICLPEDYYTSNKSFPVVYLLHGLGDDETSWLEYGRVSQISDQLVKEKEIVPMIFVMPQGFRSYYVNDYAGTFRYRDMFIQELIPFIDSHYRTMDNKNHRATMGYSMGGFGALVLPLKNPEVINTCVPMSISIRTDEQYMEEDGSEWDNQWGRIFGGTGKVGSERITEYYKQNSPFHIFMQNDLTTLSSLKIYIDNGDDEHTLCRSNEELHMLMRKREVPHEFRVRNGGHEFYYWRGALPNGLRFISDSFEGKPYRGDLPVKTNTSGTLKTQLVEFKKGNCSCPVYLPNEYKYTTRNYPVIYIMGDFNNNEMEQMTELIHQNIENGQLPPMLAAILPIQNDSLSTNIITSIESGFRIRKGFRFRAIIGMDSSSAFTFKEGIKPENYTVCAIFNSTLSENEIQKMLQQIDSKSLNRTWFYVVAPDKGSNYSGNGTLHILLRDKDIYHEYRVYEGTGKFDELSGYFTDLLLFIAKKFHN
ncbi:MAG TPA: hypothetical protein DCQ26_07825 [Marinilabiliales bacterium]|nr:MAG: hypothetical protein A2W95_01260 [Bacteroidetes bacterium GWA2_40_14]OFX57952.1 MAG: hypothetical protein A2W84_17155 [Bacteroidetes bacterium GWC2_40_13]OFX73387.1 MAG: hypothetical protein A2W96_03730 [Bacteroidetes bacterium GWD2_40_43]OFX94737.1 MAG: hypothetical protein A2W97_18635 [Bacteroidetes bacterium GWE2_40_63]OFY24733.1 MAG: hypothetical protein A2W88_16675 [Bacteroidetes bacterium GWF2_40_13]OFZ24029.1 MAG: hypothetical protein A2437_02590 [Bacteroidetes bacterium RIFOXYC